MNGNIGFYELKPDQMQVINPLLILTFIPLYELIFYPLLSLIGIRRPLQKLTLGGIFAGIAFVLSAFVEMSIEPTYAVLAQKGESQLRIFNNRPCDYTFTSNIPDHASFMVNATSFYEFEKKHITLTTEKANFRMTIQAATGNCDEDVGTEIPIELIEATAQSIHLSGLSGRPLMYSQYEDDPQKTRRGWSKVRFLTNVETNANLTLVQSNKDGTVRHNVTRNDISTSDVPFEKNYKLRVGQTEVADDIQLEVGAVYTFLIHHKADNSLGYNLITVTTPNSVNMLWLVPQYVVMTLGEVRA